MLTFCIVDMGNHFFRCVLDEAFYFDFSVSQLELFGYEHFFNNMKSGVGSPLYELCTGVNLGDIASVRYLKDKDEVWVLVRNGVRGELYSRYLGG